MLSGSAEAKVRCTYWAVSGGQQVALGRAKAKKGSKACKRARRRCNRELERKYKKGQVARGVVCRKQTEVGS